MISFNDKVNINWKSDELFVQPIETDWGPAKAHFFRIKYLITIHSICVAEKKFQSKIEFRGKSTVAAYVVYWELDYDSESLCYILKYIELVECLVKVLHQMLFYYVVCVSGIAFILYICCFWL